MPYQILSIMDAKLTVSFDEDVIKRAKDVAARQGISLSRMLEFLLRKAVSSSEGNYYNWPIADWVMELAEGNPEYRTKPLSNKDIRAEAYEYRASKKG